MEKGYHSFMRSCMLLCLLLVAFAASAQDETTSLNGDVNCDNEVNIADVNAVIAIILGEPVDTVTFKRADVNHDNEVNIADVNFLINIILNS